MCGWFQPFSIKRCFNVVSTLKQQLTLFQPYFNVEGRSCAGWEATELCFGATSQMFFFIKIFNSDQDVLGMHRYEHFGRYR